MSYILPPIHDPRNDPMLWESIVMPKSIDTYPCPNMSDIIPFVNGTVESHRIPSIEAKIKTVNSFFGEIINTKNNSDLMLYSTDNKFFLDNFEPKYPKDSVPMMLNSPIKDKADAPTHAWRLLSFKKAGKCVPTKVTWNPHTKNPVVRRI